MRGPRERCQSVFIGASNQLGEFESGATAALLGPVGSVVLGASARWWWRVCGCACSRRWAQRDALVQGGTAGTPRRP